MRKYTIPPARTDIPAFMRNTLRFFLLAALLFFTPDISASPFPHSRIAGPVYGFSYSGAGVISIFKVDTRHSEAAVPRAGFGGMFRMNFFATQNVHIQLGLEVMSQACAFNTYYFAPGYSTLYDRSFGYTHTLRTAEMYIPLLARIGLTPGEASARKIFYLIGGYSPKLFLTATTNVVSNLDGKGVWGGGTTLDFENWFIDEQMGNVMIAGMGLDQRLKFSEKFISYELLFRYNLSRFIYHGNLDTNELLIKNMCFSLQVGYRFAGGMKGGGM